jgi:hypothetical protein
MPDVQVHCFCDITVSAGLLKESALLHLGRVQSHLGLVLKYYINFFFTLADTKVADTVRCFVTTPKNASVLCVQTAEKISRFIGTHTLSLREQTSCETQLCKNTVKWVFQLLHGSLCAMHFENSQVRAAINKFLQDFDESRDTFPLEAHMAELQLYEVLQFFS